MEGVHCHPCLGFTVLLVIARCTEQAVSLSAFAMTAPSHWLTPLIDIDALAVDNHQ